MKKVYYFPSIGNDDFSKEHLPPDYMITPTKYGKGYDRNYSHAKCPAWKEYFKNTWVFYQPFDLGMYYNSNDKYLQTNLAQEIFDEYFLLASNWLDGELPEIQFKLGTALWTRDNDVWVEQVPHPLLARYGLECVPGTYPLSVWQRPIGFGFKLLDLDTNLFLPRGTPLFMLRLYSMKGDSSYSLKKEKPPEDILEQYQQNSRLKEFDKHASWDLIQDRLKKEKTCPFDFLWKRQR
tara:strand:- start:1196 stop:1903 length:708 start_codon:yes stop_codon:yes gene_type:complete